MPPDSILNYKNNIIKYTRQCIIFFDKDHVYKQYPFKQYSWVNELAITSYLNNNIPNNTNIIKFEKYDIFDDNIVDVKRKKIYLTKKEKVIRLTMSRYSYTLDNLSFFRDSEVFYIIDRLLDALFYCHSLNVLHRDVKENNVFLNCTYNDTMPNKRYLKNLVLADFNISKYKYNSSPKRAAVMTESHRSPEIWAAMSDAANKINYNEKIDVWGFCIILTYVITSKSFYTFLTDSFLKLDESILFDAKKIRIVLEHFLKIYASELQHIQFFKKIIFMGIAPYDTRASLLDIYTEFQTYIRCCGEKYREYAIKPINDIRFSLIRSYSPERVPTEQLIIDTIFIREFHDIMQYNNNVMSIYYTNLKKIYPSIYQSTTRRIDRYNTLFGLYILITFIVCTKQPSFSHCIDMVQFMTLNHEFTSQLELNNVIQKSIIKFLRYHDYRILY